MDKAHNEIIGMSHSYFSGRNVNPDVIREFIQRMKQAYPDTKLDEAWLFSKLESIHSVFIGTATTLDDATGHEEWFNPTTNTATKRELSWHFWGHYKEYLIKIKGWPPRVVEGIDSLSSEILSRIEDPYRPGQWDRRGMAMGSVQSGKTASYTALTTKAADAGYKLFIVLAGVHNSLRSQTQLRLNEEFLGYDLDKVQKLTGWEKRIGVRRMFEDHRAVYTLTSSNELGDFKAAVAQQSGIFPSREGPPIILIIKKNVSILKNLITWVQSMMDSAGRRSVPDIPLLVIDDECDYASVNTKKPEIDDNTGKIIDEWDPTTTNRLIRQLLFMFDKSAYVGYTATPYANIFIHKDHTHARYGEDLFPRSFIISLPEPSNYLGPERVFGLEEDPNRGVEETKHLPLIRLVEDHSDLIPNQRQKTLVIGDLTESMKRAIKSFLLSCAVRAIRKEGIPHNSMLIHVTRYTAVQEQIYQLVENELRRLAARIMSGEGLDDFKDIWENDYLKSTRDMADLGFHDAVEHSWQEVVDHLHQTTRVVRLKLINGTARDSLDYKDAEVEASNRSRSGENVPWEERGISIIAIGGDKLSRGLTLEGLTVSYYLRTSTMYDTLMQMGRWFGYREGYSDLCRIYTTDELLSWYRHIAGATKELREEIEYMRTQGETPTNFGLKVRSHPGRLVVTSAGKSRYKEEISLSYAGKTSETVVFDPRHSLNNRDALGRLIIGIGRGCDYDINPRKPRYHWKGISPDKIINFLNAYRTQDEAKKVVDPGVLARFIERQNRNGELVEWDVVIVSNPDAPPYAEIGGYKIGCVKRSPLSLTKDKISIRRLVSPADEMSDFSPQEIELAREFDRTGRDIPRGENEDPSGIAIREIRPEKRGLLLIYILWGKDELTGREYGISGEEIIGFALSFPTSETAQPVEYWVNPVYIEEEEHYT